MTSYQKLKQTIAYHKQRAADIEKVLHRIDAELGKRGLVVSLGLPPGIRGDAFLNDINMPDPMQTGPLGAVNITFGPEKKREAG